MRKPLLISLACVLGAVALLFWGFNLQKPAPIPAQGRYVLLIENDTGTFLMQLRKGMQEAAAIQGARLTVQIVARDPAAQAEALAATNTTAAILLLSDPAPMLAALESAEVPALVVGQTMRGQVCVVSDDNKAGAMLLARALSLAEPSQILLLTDEPDGRAKERAAGAGQLSEYRQIPALPWADGMEIPKAYPVLVAMGSRITRALADAKASGALPPHCQVLGVDTGESRVADLESGRVSALTMDNPYAMGYLAVEKARILADGLLLPSLFSCAAPLIDTENMYLNANVKLVFPLLQ